MRRGTGGIDEGFSRSLPPMDRKRKITPTIVHNRDDRFRLKWRMKDRIIYEYCYVFYIFLLQLFISKIIPFKFSSNIASTSDKIDDCFMAEIF
jgi:hypothetical protein